MLGYRDLNGAINSEEDADKFLKFMDSNKSVIEFHESMRRSHTDTTYNVHKFYEVNYAFVSDSLIVSYKPKEISGGIPENLAEMHTANTLIMILMQLMGVIFNCIQSHGIFLRGGISQKYSKIQDNIAVGAGVMEAYKIESKIAKGPRIVISEEILQNKGTMKSLEVISKMMYNGNSPIAKDEDGHSFLDYLGLMISSIDEKIEMIENAKKTAPDAHAHRVKFSISSIEKHRDAITMHLQKLKGRQEGPELENVKSKYKWLEHYHNNAIKRLKILSHLEVKPL